MKEITRRGFLRVLSGASAVIAITSTARSLMLYDEQDLERPISLRYRDWVEDRGDFYVVRVPSGKSFAKEFLNKPVVMILGRGSLATNLRIDGFVNLYGDRGSVLSNTYIDSSGYQSVQSRSALKLYPTNVERVSVSNCRFAERVDRNIGIPAMVVHGVTINIDPPKHLMEPESYIASYTLSNSK